MLKGLKKIQTVRSVLVPLLPRREGGTYEAGDFDAAILFRQKHALARADRWEKFVRDGHKLKGSNKSIRLILVCGSQVL